MPHLTDNELAGYLDGDLAPSSRRRIEAHLDACDMCREEAVAVNRLVVEHWEKAGLEAGRPRLPDWRIPAGVAGLAAAAVLAGLLLVAPDGGPTAAPPTIERTVTEGVATLTVQAPSDGQLVDRGELLFAWSDHGTASYRITITAEDGGLVWTRTTTDTTAVPPSSLGLEEGHRYFWYVDAMSAGVVARTPVHSFRIAP